MTSIEDQLSDFRAFARMHSPAIDEELATGRRIFSYLDESSSTDPEDHIALANIYEVLCLRPLRNRCALDPCDIELLSVWLTVPYAIAFCSIAWPDGVSFMFATKLHRNDECGFDFLQSFPYEPSPNNKLT